MTFYRFGLALLILAVLGTSANAASLWVAVGYGGRRISSHDGFTWVNDQRWSDEAKDDDNVLFNVAYGRVAGGNPGRFIAVGGGARIGHILWTEDGKSWNELPKLKGRVATIAFGRDRFVAAHGPELLHSTDGVTFVTGAKLAWKGSVHPRKSVFGEGEGGGMFVIIGDVDLREEGRRARWRAATADGVSLAKTEILVAPASDIAFGAGHFVSVGSTGLIETSHDGLTWTQRESDPEEDFQSVAWTGTRFIAQGKSTWTSTDAFTWVRGSPRPPAAIAWANELTESPKLRGVAIGWGGNLFTTPDLREWTNARLAPGPSLNAVAASP